MSHVELKLTKDEALVLFEFLCRFSNDDALTIDDQAEERALWNLQCVLEKVIEESFSPDYRAILEAARSRLRDE